MAVGTFSEYCTILTTLTNIVYMCLHRSKSCERVATVLDRLSSHLASTGLEPAPAPPTPTPSLLHSVAARAIPCVDIKVSGTYPCSIYYDSNISESKIFERLSCYCYCIGRF